MIRSGIHILAILSLLLLSGCRPTVNEGLEDQNLGREYPAEVMKMFEAHGGLDTWKAQSSLSYHFATESVKEIHTIDLRNRKTLINGEGYDIGFNGQQVWISPDKSNFKGSSPRFYHNLYFYFHSLVFLVADEGIHYDLLNSRKIGDKQYLAISISYDEHIGDSPDDEYILFLDPETYRLEQIMYTVTYFNGIKSNKYNGLKYSEWIEKDGLTLPTEIIGYTVVDGEFIEERYKANFSEISLSDDHPEQSIFEVPELAIIDSLTY